jgi:hypothetical protein
MRMFYVEYEMLCFDGLTGNQMFHDTGIPIKYHVKRYMEGDSEAAVMDELEYGNWRRHQKQKYTTVSVIYEV